MTTLAFVLIGIVGSVIGIVVIKFAAADYARTAREVRADMAAIGAAREATAPASADSALPTDGHGDSHAPGWEPISPDLIA